MEQTQSVVQRVLVTVSRVLTGMVVLSVRSFIVLALSLLLVALRLRQSF